jgi:hypothetical protein
MLSVMGEPLATQLGPQDPSSENTTPEYWVLTTVPFAKPLKLITVCARKGVPMAAKSMARRIQKDFRIFQFPSHSAQVDDSVC